MRKRKNSPIKKILKIIAVIYIMYQLVKIFVPEEEYTVSYSDDDWGYEEISETASTGQETYTVMIYIIGSDLESDGGCATDDIEEMLNADLGDRVNVVLQTGGALRWENSGISARTCQRFSLKNGRLVEEDDIGRQSMVEPDTVSDFIKWTEKNYPADRYSLIFWNHGGGTIMGFGSDEYYPNDMLTLEKLETALADGGVHMDMVGFDACLMGTIETAYMLQPYADYLLASEELEPGNGWYYTGWLNELGSDPGISTVKLGRKIIEDYVNGPDASFWDDLTLALVDLNKIPELYDRLCSFMNQSRVALRNSGYQAIASARSGTRSYGEGDYEQVDIADYVSRSGVTGADRVLEGLSEAVVCFDTNLEGSNGLAMYFPYSYPQYYEQTSEMIEEIGLEDENYQGFFDDFVNILVYGQGMGGSSLSPMESLTGFVQETEYYDYEAAGWYDAEVGETCQGEVAVLGDGELYLEEKGDDYVLSLTDEEWDTISYIEMQVYLDDEAGYLELGQDNVYDFDEDGDLIVDFNYTWVALNETIVPFYAEQEGIRPSGGWYTYGYVPAELNGEEDIEIMIYWDDEHEGGYVAGYRPKSDEKLSVPARNLRQFERGDEIAYYADYYTYEGDYDASYYLGEPVVYGAEGLTVSYEELDEYTAVVYYYLLDIYNNEYWTESIEIYFE